MLIKMTTEKELKEIVDLLNSNSKNFYKLDYAYGKVKLVKGMVGCTGILNVTGYMSRPNMAEVLYGIQNYMSYENRYEKEKAEFEARQLRKEKKDFEESRTLRLNGAKAFQEFG
jgi:hypothetical protein